MPVHKGRNVNGRLHQHQRALSGGSCKVGLSNLQLAQKDPVQPKQQLKRTGHSAVELVHPARTTSPFQRPLHLNSNVRVQSKERIATLQQKRARTPVSAKRQQTQTSAHRVGTFVRSDGTDEDDWVSSESGAATPQNDDDDDDGARGATPVDRQRAGPPTNNVNGNADRAANGVVEPSTPRAGPELAQIEAVRPETSSQAQMRAQPPAVLVQPLSTPVSPVLPTNVETSEVLPIRHTRSEAPSPTQLRQKTATKRHPLMRHSSTYGESKVDMHPHPLIRGQTCHSSLKPPPLAPLTVNSEAAQAQLSASPTSAIVSSRSGSPTYLKRSFTLQSPSEASVLSEGRNRAPSRKGSISSLHSIATLPAPAGSRSKQDRTRTLSTYSTSSSSAALHSLNMLPAMSRPVTPPMTVHFPAESRRDAQDGYHQLLPPPYLAAHMTVNARYNPLFDCYERVMRAKHGR